jgi:hypothetical protein
MRGGRGEKREGGEVEKEQIEDDTGSDDTSELARISQLLDVELGGTDDVLRCRG